MGPEGKHLFDFRLTRTHVRGVMVNAEHMFVNGPERRAGTGPAPRAGELQMAIAPLIEPDRELPWPRPTLRLVPAVTAPAPVPSPCRRPAVAPVRPAADVSVRRRARASLRVRRRRLAVGLALTALAVGLALPPSVLGGHDSSGAASALSGAVLGGRGTTYVVQAGDTPASIARQVDPGDPAPLARAIVRQAGSGVLVPGEHLTLP